jgi:hypothetical protein
MDDRQREARVQTLQAELEAERRRRVAAEAEAVAARAASDELKLHVQRAGLEQPIQAQRLRRSGLLILLALLVMGLAATATIGIVYFRRVEGGLRDDLTRANRRIAELARERIADQRAAAELTAELDAVRRRQAQASANLLACLARTPAPDAPPSAPAGDDVSQLLAMAERAFSNTECPRAMEIARKVIALQPTHQRAIQILGVCACNAKNRPSAQWAHDKLTGFAKSALKQLCARNGVTLE